MPTPAPSMVHVLVLEPFTLGHTVYKLDFMARQIRSLPGGPEIIPVGNKSATPKYLGLTWQNISVHQRMPMSVFLAYIGLVMRTLKKKPGKKFLLNLAYDGTWYYLGVLALLLAPLFRALGIHLVCLHFRSCYLKRLSGLTDLAKYCVFLLLRILLGKGFTLLTTHPDNPLRKRVCYLPDLMDIPGPLPTRNEARASLGLAPGQKILLFFGNIHDRRKGFSSVVRLLDHLPEGWTILLQRQQEGEYSQFVREHGDRLHVVEKTVDNRTKSLMFRAADGVLLLYPENFGGSSGVLTDAVFHGTPILTTRFPYAVAMLERYQIGYPINADSHESWRQALRHLETDHCEVGLHRCRDDLLQRFKSELRSLFAS